MVAGSQGGNRCYLWSREIGKEDCCGFLNRSDDADLEINRLSIQNPLVNPSLFQSQAGTLATFPATNRARGGEKKSVQTVVLPVRIKNERPGTRGSQMLCVANILASINLAAETVHCKTHQPVISYCSLSSTMHSR